MCGGGPAWKREVVPDHKFDFIDVREYHSKEFGIRFRYFLFYCSILTSFLVYMSDIFTAVTYLSTDDWSNIIQKSCQKGSDNGCVVIPFQVGRWLFVGCIIFSFLLLAYEARKAKKIIASRDISYSFTNVMTHNYYSLRSYDHFCLFCTISNSTKKKDDFAFFVFFTFKELASQYKPGWKRLLLADGPRQSINAINLYGFYLSKLPEKGSVFDLGRYSNNFVTSALIVVSLFTVLVFILSSILLITAAICYVPLLCYIRGNLKEYCCHKVDKRIAELIKRKTKQRLAKQAALEAKEAAGDYSHLKNKQGQIVGTILPQPTLPTVYLEAEEEVKPQRSKQLTPAPSWPPSEYASTDYASTIHLDYGDYPPPMPEYQPYSHAQPQGQYLGYGQSVATLPQDEGYDKYDDTDYGSTYHLTLNAAPPAEVPQRQRSTSPYANPYSTPTPDPYPGYAQQQQPNHGGGVARGYDYGTNYY